MCATSAADNEQAEPVPAWLRQRWQSRLVATGLLVLLLGSAAIWTAAAVLAVTVLWRHSKDPEVAVFFGVWLPVWASFPVTMVRRLRARGRSRAHRPMV